MSRFRLPLLALLLLLGGCTELNPTIVSQPNSSARLLGISQNWPPWRLITTGVNRIEGTMFNLNGNDIAIQHARRSESRTYPVGSQLLLVTWRLQEDSRWFGGRIPATPKAVEFVKMRDAGNGHVEPAYSRYEGTPLKKSTSGVNMAKSRIDYLLSFRAAVMP